VAHSGYSFFHLCWQNRKCLASGRVKLNALKHFDFSIVIGKIVWALASIPGSATNLFSATYAHFRYCTISPL